MYAVYSMQQSCSAGSTNLNNFSVALRNINSYTQRHVRTQQFLFSTIVCLIWCNFIWCILSTCYFLLLNGLKKKTQPWYDVVGNVWKLQCSEIPCLDEPRCCGLQWNLVDTDSVMSDELQDVWSKTSFSTPAMRTPIYRKVFLMNQKEKNACRWKVFVKHLFRALVAGWSFLNWSFPGMYKHRFNYLSRESGHLNYLRRYFTYVGAY